MSICISNYLDPTPDSYRYFYNSNKEDPIYKNLESDSFDKNLPLLSIETIMADFYKTDETTYIYESKRESDSTQPLRLYIEITLLDEKYDPKCIVEDSTINMIVDFADIIIFNNDLATICKIEDWKIIKNDEKYMIIINLPIKWLFGKFIMIALKNVKLPTYNIHINNKNVGKKYNVNKISIQYELDYYDKNMRMILIETEYKIITQQLENFYFTNLDIIQSDDILHTNEYLLSKELILCTPIRGFFIHTDYFNDITKIELFFNDNLRQSYIINDSIKNYFSLNLNHDFKTISKETLFGGIIHSEKIKNIVIKIWLKNKPSFLNIHILSLNILSYSFVDNIRHVNFKYVPQKNSNIIDVKNVENTTNNVIEEFIVPKVLTI
jgi:hypothetical protein